MPYVESRGSSVYYEAHGDEDREVLMCIGGWGILTKEHFDDLPERWRDRYRVVVYDHRGLGDSDPEPSTGSTWEVVADALAVLDAVGADAVHLVGQGGLGGCLAQTITITAPERVLDLVIASGWAGPEPFHDFQLESLYLMRRDHGFEAFRRLCMTYTHFPEAVNRAPDEVGRGWSGPGNIHERDEAHLGLIKSNIGHDARDRLGEIACPALVVCGELDHLGGPRLASEIAALIPGARLEVLTGVPHVFGLVEGAPARYAELVDEFFSESALTPR